MSKQYPGGVISKTPPTPSGSYQNSTAPGVWTLEQQAYWQKLGQWPTQGNVDPNAFIENLFSTYLYTGNGSTQTITNGIDLSTYGGLVWIKARTNTSGGATAHALVDSARGTSKWLSTDSTGAQSTNANLVTGFTTSGFSVGTAPYWANESGIPYVSWAFRKQAKFYTQGTYTGTGSVQNITHDLGSVPGCIIVKDITNSGSAWAIYHTSLGNTQYLQFTTAQAGTSSGYWNNTSPTSTQFTVGTNGNVNTSGATYVYYAFASNAGGFGYSGSDNVITCGTYTGTGSALNVTLGYEAQWVMIKRAVGGTGEWAMFDVMRGMSVIGNDSWLYADTSDAEQSAADQVNPLATGFRVTATGTRLNYSGDTYIYIAIRRGKMQTPTVGTTVFAPTTYTGNGATGRKITSSNTTDLSIIKGLDGASGTSGGASSFTDRIRGGGSLGIASNQGDMNGYWTLLDWLKLDVQTGIQIGATSYTYSNASGGSFVNYTLSRAYGFFDIVYYSGTGSATTQTHNLGVAPELMIVKVMDTSSTTWAVYSAALGNTYTMVLSATDAKSGPSSANWNSTTPTASVFSLGTGTNVNGSGLPYIAYLFATAPGVSKVGSYTGTATTLQINCSFTAGARFVMIKRTDSTGDWYFWDSARGIVSGNDPYVLMNSDAIQVTGTDYVDTYSAGFEISSTAPAAINASGGTFIFLAIA